MKFEILPETAAAVTQISTFDGETIRIRGISIEDLMETTYLEAAYLVIYSKLPNERELARFATNIDHQMEPSSAIYQGIKTMPKNMGLIEALRAVISTRALDEKPIANQDAETLRQKGLDLMAQIPAIIVALSHHRHGIEPLHPRRGRGFVRNFLWMLLGREPEEFELWAFERTLIVHIENELNISTYAARLAISTQSDFYSAIIAALSVLKGALHGGANQRVAEMIDEIGSVGEVSSYLKTKFEAREKIMGFGHLIYKKGDPRAPLLRSIAKVLAEEKEESSIFEIFKAVEDEMREQKKLLPNVDFYSACIFKCLGIEAGVFPAIFSLARFPSWIAHMEEQMRDNRLMVARAEYQGIASAGYRPMSERS